MPIYISQNGNREVWPEKPDNYFTDDEWKEIHPDRVYSTVGTGLYRLVCYPYEGIFDNEVEMNSLPPNDISISDSDGNWIESDELRDFKITELRNSKLADLNDIFDKVSGNAHCMSSLGIEINADESANRNISSLIIALEATGQETVQFCSFDNTFREVTLTQLKTMQLEIIANAQMFYQKKWELREQINTAETLGELDAITISFVQGDSDGQTA